MSCFQYVLTNARPANKQRIHGGHILKPTMKDIAHTDTGKRGWIDMEDGTIMRRKSDELIHQYRHKFYKRHALFHDCLPMIQSVAVLLNRSRGHIEFRSRLHATPCVRSNVEGKSNKICRRIVHLDSGINSSSVLLRDSGMCQSVRLPFEKDAVNKCHWWILFCYIVCSLSGSCPVSQHGFVISPISL